MIVPFDKVTTNEDNPRFITDAQFQKLVNSICDFPEMLAKRPLICVTHEDGNYRPLGGNMRSLATPEAVIELEARLKVCRDDTERRDLNRKLCILEQGHHIELADEWTPDQRDQFIIKDNVSYGEWDWDMLANEWNAETLNDWGLDIHVFAPIVNEETQEDNYTAAPLKVPKSIAGDIYELNGHRIICGDSTDPDVVNRLMDGKQAALCFTSPPYWVGMAYETQKNEQEIDEFITRIAATICFATRKAYGRVVINTGTASINRIDKKRRVEILPLIDKWQRALRLDGWLLRHLRIWVKNGNMPAIIGPKTDTISQYNEYLGRFEQEENEEYSQVMTAWNPEGEQRGQERIKTPWAQQGRWDDLPPWKSLSVWSDIQGDKSAGGKHIAAFPVELPGRNIRLYSQHGEIVFEPFCGSGTTVLACEQLNRACFAIEMDPVHVDTTVRRWVNWMKGSGKELEVLRNGKNITKEPWLYE